MKRSLTMEQAQQMVVEALRFFVGAVDNEENLISAYGTAKATLGRYDLLKSQEEEKEESGEE